MADRVFPMKMEVSTRGGTENDTRPTTAQVNEDGLMMRSVFLQADSGEDSTVELTRDASGNLVFRDGLYTAGKTLNEVMGYAYAKADSDNRYLQLTGGTLSATSPVINAPDGLFINIDSDSSTSSTAQLNIYANRNSTTGGTHIATFSELGRFGIGTTSPSFELHVVGAANITTTLTTGQTTNLANGVLYATSSTKRVGINNVSPSYPLDITDSTSTVGMVRFSNTATSGAASMFCAAASAQIYVTAFNSHATYTNFNGWGRIHTNANGNGLNLTTEGANKPITFSTGATAANQQPERMRILGDGKVGIGTTAPGELLEVAGNVKTSSQFISTVATGTAPLSITSTTAVANLNADLLDGQHASDFVLKSGDTMTGTLSFNSSNLAKLELTHSTVTAKGRITNDANGLWLQTNAYYDGTNWQRDDTTKASFAIAAGHLGNSRIELRAIPAGTGAITWNTALIINAAGTAAFSYATTVNNTFTVASGGGAFSLKSGSSTDHVYMQFYARQADQSARSAYMGYGSNGSTTFITNNALGSIELKADTVASGNIDLRPGTSGTTRSYASMNVYGTVFAQTTGNLVSESAGFTAQNRGRFWYDGSTTFVTIDDAGTTKEIRFATNAVARMHIGTDGRFTYGGGNLVADTSHRFYGGTFGKLLTVENSTTEVVSIASSGAITTKAGTTWNLSGSTGSSGSDFANVTLGSDRSYAALVASGGATGDLGFTVWDAKNNRSGDVKARYFRMDTGGGVVFPDGTSQSSAANPTQPELNTTDTGIAKVKHGTRETFHFQRQPSGNIALEMGVNEEVTTFIDLHATADASQADHSARFIRWAGVNGNLDIVNQGGGDVAVHLNASPGKFLVKGQHTTQAIIGTTYPISFTHNWAGVGFNTYFSGSAWVRYSAAPAALIELDPSNAIVNHRVVESGTAGSTIAWSTPLQLKIGHVKVDGGLAGRVFWMDDGQTAGYDVMLYANTSVNAVSANRTIYLPHPNGLDGRMYFIKRADNDPNYTITVAVASSGLFDDGFNTYTLGSRGGLIVIAYNNRWQRIAAFP